MEAIQVDKRSLQIIKKYTKLKQLLYPVLKSIKSVYDNKHILGDITTILEQIDIENRAMQGLTVNKCLTVGHERKKHKMLYGKHGKSKHI